jgi:CCR4-NOT transcription complex subunit 1
MNDLDGLLSQIPAVTLNSLPANSDIRAVVRQPLLLVMQCTEKEKPALQMSQRIVQYLYKTQAPLGREVYVAMLDNLCQNFREVQKEATEWLIYAEDEVR